MVKMNVNTFTNDLWVGYIIEMGHNGHGWWAKVKFFDDIEDTYTTYIEKLRKA